MPLILQQEQRKNAVRIVIDTNRYADLASAQPEAIEFFKSVSSIFVPFCVVAELRSGFIGGNRLARNEKLLRTFLAWPRVEIIYPDRATLDHWAYLDATLRAHHKKIPHNDIWIAAIAIQNGCVVYSRDTHFDQIPGIQRVV